MIKRKADILAAKVFNLWRREYFIWCTTNYWSLGETCDHELIGFIVPIWALVCYDVGIFRTTGELLSWLGRLAHCPLAIVVDYLKDYENNWFHESEAPDISSQLRPVVAPFLQEWQRVTREEHPWLCKEGAMSLRKLRTAFLFLSHLTLHDTSCVEKGYQKFDDNFERLKSVKSLPTPYMVNWVANLCKSADPFGEHYTPHHGSGATAETAGRPIKKTPRYKYRKSATWQVKFTLRNIPNEVLPPVYRNNVLQCSEAAKYAVLADVPKGISSVRIIGFEPSHKMFMQQGVRHVIDVDIFQHGYAASNERMCTHVNLHDQSMNRDMARWGSISRDYATIDLSSASDSVRWDFVEHLFSDSPRWQRALRLTRTRQRVYPDGRVETNVHYAPMGSALCFPIEVIAFCAIIEEAIHIDGGHHRRYSVYGDDIVIHESHYNTVVSLLTDFGFKVNEEKSFHGDCPFREACGGFYYNGWDVTPIRVGRFFVYDSENTSSTINSLVDLSNRLFGGDYPIARRTILKELMHITNNCIIFTDNPDKSNFVMSSSPCNTHLKIREDRMPRDPSKPYYQKDKYLAYQPVNRNSKDFERGTYLAYFDWWIRTERSNLPDEEETRLYERPAQNTWCLRWTSLW